MENFVQPKWNLLRNISKDWYRQEIDLIDFEKNEQFYMQLVKQSDIKGKFSYMLDDKKCFFIFQKKSDCQKFTQILD